MERATEKERERGRTCSAGSSYSCDVTKISAVRFAIGLPAFAEFNIEHSHALSRKHHANPTNRTLLSYLSRHIEEKSKKKRETSFLSVCTIRSELRQRKRNVCTVLRYFGTCQRAKCIWNLCALPPADIVSLISLHDISIKYR